MPNTAMPAGREPEDSRRDLLRTGAALLAAPLAGCAAAPAARGVAGPAGTAEITG